MKNMKKLLQRAMVFTLSAAMLVGTPMTASAAGLVDLYSVSDGTNPLDPNDTTPTGTVTNTDTNTTTTVLAENEARIIGISLDQTDLTVEVGTPAEKRQKITATVIMDWGENQPSNEAKEKITKALNSKIKWEVLNPDETKSNPLPATILAIEASAADRTVVTLNPQKGNKEKMIVRASIDGRYVWKAERDEEGNLVRDENGEIVFETEKTELKDTKDVLFKADAKVFVKEYAEELWFDWNENKVKDSTDTYTNNVGEPPVAYLKHTVDMNKYLGRDPETANDTITWVSSNTKAATVTAAGVVTFKKKDESGSIIAISERGNKVEWTFTVDPGVAASKVEIVKPSDNKTFDKNRTEVDLNKNVDKNDGWTATNANNENSTLPVEVKMYAKVNAGIGADGNVVTASSETALNSIEVVDQGTAEAPKFKAAKKDVENGLWYYEISSDKKTKTARQVKVTDVIDWTSNKGAFADVASKEGNTNTITATSVGKTSITAKASNGKKASLAVTVKATLGALTIDPVKDNTLYSGQSVTLTYTPDPRASKDGVKWSVVAKKADGTEVKNQATITAKGVLTIKPQLACDKVVVTLESKKNGITAGNKSEKITTTKELTVKQSSIDGISVIDDNDVEVANVYADYSKSKVAIKKNTLTDKKNNTTTINAEKGRTYVVDVTAGRYPENNEYGNASTLSWKTSKAAVADIKNNGSTVLITAHQKGSATITVSGVRVDDKGKAKAISTTFKVNVEQPVKTLTMNKSSVVLNQKNKKVSGEDKPQNQKVALKATLGPKGVKNTDVTWTVWKNGVLLDDMVALGLVSKGKPITKASVSINLPTPEVGNVFKITASTASGASATTTVTVVKNTTEVAIADADETKVAENGTVAKDDLKRFSTKNGTVANTAELKIGETLKMMPVINVGDAEKKKDGKPEWVVAGTNDTEQITYSVNRKGIVNIDADGNVYAVNSGTVTITAKTPLNKKATLKITVPKPVAPTVPDNSAQ